MCTSQVYAGPLAGGARAVVLFNRHTFSDSPGYTQDLTVYWKAIGLPAAEMVLARPSLPPLLITCF